MPAPPGSRAGGSARAARARSWQHPEQRGAEPELQREEDERGEQQRLAIARVLLKKPSWVFADEATGLDAVEVLIYRLRKKLETSAASHSGPAEVVITTFRGMGYMLTSPSGVT